MSEDSLRHEPDSLSHAGDDSDTASRVGYHSPFVAMVAACRLKRASYARRTWLAPSVDAHGRFALGPLISVLGWGASTRLACRLDEHRYVVRELGEGERTACGWKLRLDTAGRIRLPAALRARVSVTAPGRVVVAASEDELWLMGWGLIEDCLFGEGV